MAARLAVDREAMEGEVQDTSGGPRWLAATAFVAAFALASAFFLHTRFFNDDALITMGERWGSVRQWERMVRE